MIDTIIHLLINALVIVANAFILLLAAAAAVRVYMVIKNLLTLKKLQKIYPVYGGVKVELVYKDRIRGDGDGIAQGSVNYRTKIMRLALMIPHKKFVENYLHERRHTEQMFSGDEELFALYERGKEQMSNTLYYSKILHMTPFDIYWNSPHEVDARDWAKKTTEEYLK